ncbi:hypothetical protein BH23ACT2_BH23ACT2_20880 [soil metagenome]
MRRQEGPIPPGSGPVRRIGIGGPEPRLDPDGDRASTPSANLAANRRGMAHVTPHRMVGRRGDGQPEQESPGMSPPRSTTRRTSRLSVAAVVCSLLMAGLAACGGGGSADNVLRWYIYAEPSGAFVDAAADCTEAAEGRYVIETVDLPANADEQREQLVRRLAAGDRDIDIIGMDVIWTAEGCGSPPCSPPPAGRCSTRTAPRSPSRTAPPCGPWRSCATWPTLRRHRRTSPPPARTTPGSSGRRGNRRS